MPLETASYINQLDGANPLGSDPIASGDDHIRLIKTAVKNTFPNITGPINLTQDAINVIPSDIDAVEASVSALSSSTSASLSSLNTAKADKTISISPGTGLTGGGDLSANRSIALANTAVTPGSYGSSTKLARVTVDAQGRITAAQEYDLPAPVVLAQGAYSVDTTYSVPVSASNRPIQINLHYAGIQGGNTSISVQFQWGLGGLTDQHTPINNVGVNYVVYPSPSLTAYVTPSSNTNLYFRVNDTNLDAGNLFVSIIQL